MRQVRKAHEPSMLPMLMVPQRVHSAANNTLTVCTCLSRRLKPFSRNAAVRQQRFERRAHHRRPPHDESETSDPRGEKCERIMASKVVNMKVRDTGCDELWSYVGKNRSTYFLRTIRALVMPIRSVRLSGIPNWFSTSPLASATKCNVVFVEGLKHAT
jgi:hypothetical protein